MPGTTIRPHRLPLLLAVVLATPLAAAPLHVAPIDAGGPPATPKQPVTDDYFGTKVVDSYRWLEGSAAPEVKGEDAKLDARVAAWTEKQNAYTRRVLDHVPGRDALDARLTQLLEVGSVGLPRVRGGLYFYTERRGDQAQPVLYVRKGADGSPRALVDPNSLAADGLTTLAWFEPSQDGKRVAFGLYRSGDENSTLHLLDVASGKRLPDVIPGKVRSVQWLPDGGGFLYRRLADVDNPYSGQIRFHELGSDPSHDPLLFEQYKEGPLATTWGPEAYTNDAARWLVLMYWTSTRANDLWVYDLDQWRKTGELQRHDVVVGEDALNRGPVVGNTLYLWTTLGAPNGRVVAVDLRHPERQHWKEVIPERKRAVLQGLATAEGRLVATYLENAYSHIELFDLQGKPLGPVELPGIGTARIATEEASTEAFVSFESFNQPESLYRVDLATGKRSLWARPEVPVDASRIAVEQVWYPSKDGTRVSLFLVHEKGLRKSGKVPTILTGYGGFNIPVTPAFRAERMPWLEAGGLYAVANLRGGGEYGESWHRAGMLDKKQNVFDDFIAAAEYLIREGWTDRQHLGILGGSNGGLLTGAVTMERPELFGAVVSAVPLLDMLRYQDFLMARYWVPEYGSSENPKQFAYLLRYSPYQNVKSGVKYPAMLLTAGEHDARVAALHARKMTARLQAATTSDPADKPILLWVEQEAGHGRGKPLAIRVREWADIYGFLAWQLGLPFAGEGAPAAEAPVAGVAQQRR